MTKETLYKAWSIEKRLVDLNQMLSILTSDNPNLAGAVSIIGGVYNRSEDEDYKDLVKGFEDLVRAQLQKAEKQLEEL